MHIFCYTSHWECNALSLFLLQMTSGPVTENSGETVSQNHQAEPSQPVEYHERAINCCFEPLVSDWFVMQLYKTGTSACLKLYSLCCPSIMYHRRNQRPSISISTYLRLWKSWISSSLSFSSAFIWIFHLNLSWSHKPLKLRKPHFFVVSLQ